MSLYIDFDRVVGVLLADGWHYVSNKSFDLDSYEYHHDEMLLLGGGRCEGVPSTGFRFEERTESYISTVYGPLTSILAVKYTRKTHDDRLHRIGRSATVFNVGSLRSAKPSFSPGQQQIERSRLAP